MTPQYKMIDGLITEMFGTLTKNHKNAFHAFAHYLILKSHTLGVTLHPYEAVEDMTTEERALQNDEFSRRCHD